MKDNAVVVYIDFDDTLYIHKYHWTVKDDFNYNIMYGFKHTTLDKNFLNYNLIHKVKQLCEINEKRGFKTIINLLTGSRTSLYFKAKTNLLDEQCPGLFDNYFDVISQEEKIPMIQAYNKEVAKLYNIVETIVIDDNGFVVDAMCEDLGFIAVTPLYFEKYFNITNYDNDVLYNTVNSQLPTTYRSEGLKELG